MAQEASSFDHEMPYFDTGRDFDIGFPDTLSSKIEFLTANGSIVQARARLHFKQALILPRRPNMSPRSRTHWITTMDRL